MEKPLVELRERLLRAGVAPRHVRRYLKELTDHLADLTAEEGAAGRDAAGSEDAALARLGGIDELAEAMIQQRQLRSWSARAPWVAFSVGPVAALAVAYFVAGFFLWWGWKLFVPAAETPFGYAIPPTHAIANIYFLADKSWYFGAPIVVGLGIAVIAVRQRLKHLWPTIGLGLDACVGATARIHAGRSVASGLGHISMSFFSIHSSGAAAYGELLYAAAIFLLSMLPYLAWSLWKAYPLAE